MAGLRRLDQALGDEPAAVVIAAVRQLAARLLQDDVHVRFRPLAQLCHDARLVRVACNRKHTQKDVLISPDNPGRCASRCVYCRNLRAAMMVPQTTTEDCTCPDDKPSLQR